MAKILVTVPDDQMGECYKSIKSYLSFRFKFRHSIKIVSPMTDEQRAAYDSALNDMYCGHEIGTILGKYIESLGVTDE